LVEIRPSTGGFGSAGREQAAGTVAVLLDYHLCQARSPAWARFPRRNGLVPDTRSEKPRGGTIHTFFMRFAIDVAFVSKEGRVRHTAGRTAPADALTPSSDIVPIRRDITLNSRCRHSP
jgi:uncharacterized membrane protein (UPF0127 family)